MQTTLTKKQKKAFRKDYIVNGKPETIIAHVRHDDECGNGHNTFSITGEIYTTDRQPGETTVTHRTGKTLWCNGGGCIHDEIAKHFPELAPLIKWHLTSTDGPLHYIANTVYHASDRDHRGLLKGEKRQLRNGRTKLPVWERVVRNDKGEAVQFRGGSDWVESEQKPVEKLTVDFEPVWITGEGKERDLKAARSCAVWPEATDEELMQEPEKLKAALMARHDKLMEDFKTAVESLGFTF